MKKLVVLFVVLYSINASAILIEQHYLSAQDGLITFDTSTRLQWLDVSYTRGMSIADVESSGILGHGWEWATISQIESLISGALPYRGLNEYQDGSVSTPLNNLIFTDLFGVTSSVDNQYYDWQMTAGVSKNFTWEGVQGFGVASIESLSIVADRPQIDPPGCFENNRCVELMPAISSEHERYSTMGSWLVRSVPEPSSLVLIMFGLLGILSCKRARGYV